MVRHNLTVQGEEGQGDLPQFFADHNCEVVCSLPHYTAEATDRQRGRGVPEASLVGLQALNAVGYGRGDGLVLNLVANPVGAFLPPAQDDLAEKLWQAQELRVAIPARGDGIVF